MLDQINILFNRKKAISHLVEKINETGNGFPFGNNNITVTIKYTLNNHSGFGELTKLRKLFLGIDQAKKEPDRHITLYQAHFNGNHKDINKFINFSDPLNCKVTDEFRNIINDTYINILKDKQSLSQSNEFKRMGKFYALVFHNTSNISLMGTFRDKINLNILKTKNKKKIERYDQHIPNKINTYYVYCDNDSAPVYAIQDYYDGHIWNPHASICKDDEIQGQSENVIKKLDQLIKNINIPSNVTFIHKLLSTSVKCQ